MMNRIHRIGTLLLIGFFLSCSDRQAAEEPAPPSPVHPEFALTLQQLEGMLTEYPEEIRYRATDRPEYFLELMKTLLRLPEETLVLVDKEHGLDSEYEPSELVSLDDYPVTVSRTGLSLRASILPDLLAMTEAARQDGVELVSSSTYRSYFYQAGVYARNVEQLGQAAADRESAKPGHSQHQLGTCIDFGSITDAFAATPAGRWLAEHADEYGFSLSYPDGYEELTGYRYESWHFRHIGRIACIAQNEFFGGIQQYLLTFLHEERARLLAAMRSDVGPTENDGSTGTGG
jgi:zinc D-Ala-D-Ala carboxypeptidase